MMKYKVLFIHNKYGAHSGEEEMLKRIMLVLAQNGHNVRLFSKDSREISRGFLPKALAFFSGVYSFSSKIELNNIVEEYQPDIVQIQNLFPLISPSILPILRKKRLPVVMRLANYRLVCPNGLFLTRGAICEKCRGGREYYCILRNCEKILPKSIGYALRSFVARQLRLYLDNVTIYYAQTQFQKNILVSEGFLDKKIHVIPNMASLQSYNDPITTGKYVGYVGRLSKEKGINIFLEVAKINPDIQFKVAGKSHPEIAINNLADNVEILGHLNNCELHEFYKNCKFIIMPSLCYEGFPSVIIEAMSFAKPVIASNIGGIPEVVENQFTGLLFEAGNVADLQLKINRLWNDEIAIHNYGNAGRGKVIREYSPELYYKRLMNVYKKAYNANHMKEKKF